MLYLLKLDNAYKIGYSTNIKNRIKQLQSTHVDVELISTKFGNKHDETIIHLLCKDYHIKNELFQIDDNVTKIFNTFICTCQNEEDEKANEITKLGEVISCQKALIHSCETYIKLLKTLINKISSEFEEIII